MQEIALPTVRGAIERAAVGIQDEVDRPCKGIDYMEVVVSRATNGELHFDLEVRDRSRIYLVDGQHLRSGCSALQEEEAALPAGRGGIPRAAVAVQAIVDRL